MVNKNAHIIHCTVCHRSTQNQVNVLQHKKHLKNVGPIRHCEPLHCHSPGVATVTCRLRIDVHNDNNDDNNDVNSFMAAVV